jgi:hypothetical protein
MAKLDPVGSIPWYVASCYRYRARSESEIARNVYGADGAETAAWARRQRFDAEVRQLNRVLQTGLPDEPPAQPRRPSTDAAYALWGRQQQVEANEAARQEMAQRLYEQNMKHWGFVRKGR